MPLFAVIWCYRAVIGCYRLLSAVFLGVLSGCYLLLSAVICCVLLLSAVSSGRTFICCYLPLSAVICLYSFLSPYIVYIRHSGIFRFLLSAMITIILLRAGPTYLVGRPSTNSMEIHNPKSGCRCALGKVGVGVRPGSLGMNNRGGAGGWS